jgi:TRAP-type C4-dicarboxylate transport system substrate-binding protein
MKRIAFALLAAAALAGPARAADPEVDLRISLWVPPAMPLVPAITEWAQSIEKDSGGSIKSTIFPSEQLGKAFDHYDMARDGIADVTLVNPGYQPGRFPVESAVDVPFLLSNALKGTHAVNEWYRPHAAAEMKDTHFCVLITHDPGTFHSRKKILVPDDVRGLKVRPGDSQVAALVTALGGTNVQASAPGSRDLLDRGVADTMTFPWGSILLFGIDKVVKYHLDVPLYTNTLMLTMNKDKYAAMTPAQKAVIDAHCTTAWAEKIAAPWAAFESAGREKMKTLPGHEIDEITPDQLALWKAAVQPMHAQWAAAVKAAGGDPDAIFKALQVQIDAAGAGI